MAVVLVTPPESVTQCRPVVAGKSTAPGVFGALELVEDDDAGALEAELGADDVAELPVEGVADGAAADGRSLVGWAGATGSVLGSVVVTAVERDVEGEVDDDGALVEGPLDAMFEDGPGEVMAGVARSS